MSQLNPRELANALVALRVLQKEMLFDQDGHLEGHISLDGHTLMEEGEIDSLCEKINAPEEPDPVEVLREQYDHWGEHPDYPAQDWREEASNDSTRNGYWEWVAAKIESED